MGRRRSNAIIDTTGEVRWFMNTDPIHDQYSVLESGPMLGFEQNKDGALHLGFWSALPEIRHYGTEDLEPTPASVLY